MTLLPTPWEPLRAKSSSSLNSSWKLPTPGSSPRTRLSTPSRSVTEEYPLYCAGFHHKSRTHSSFGFIPEIEAVARQQVWINPVDAEARSVSDGDVVSVVSPAGEIRIEAKVTPRIIPGTVGIPQGAWHKADMDGDKVDEGGCVNTLTTYKPTPLAKGNGPAHSMIVQVAKA